MTKLFKSFLLSSALVVLWSSAQDTWAPPPDQEAPPSRHDRRWNS